MQSQSLTRTRVGWAVTEIETLQSALRALDADISRYRAALEIIAGRRQCIDNLMGDKDIARRTLDTPWPKLSSVTNGERS